MFAHLGFALSKSSPRALGPWLVTLALLTGSVAAETAVNSYTTGNQQGPAITTDDQGRFIIVWASQDQDGDGAGIFGRRFAADGEPLGSEFAVNEYTTGDQIRPRVSADTAGNFIVVWQGNGGAPRNDVFARRFDSAGAPVAGQFRLNEDASLDQREPAVALADDGRFLSVWSNEERLVARHFDASDTPTGGDFDIAVDDTTYPNAFRGFFRRDVEVMDNGQFVIAWHDHFYAGYGYFYSDTILGSLVDIQTPVGSFSASASAPDQQHRAPSLTTTGDGGFAIVWGGYSEYATTARIVGRRFNSNGSPNGALFDPTPAGEVSLVPQDIATLDDQRFVVVWNDREIGGRILDSTGAPLTDPLRISSDRIAGGIREPVVGATGNDILISWTRDDGGPAMDEVVASNEFITFRDGFESGTTEAWSTTFPSP